MTLYGFNSTNTLKVLIALYEFDVDFEAVCVLLDGDQFSKTFTDINPNQKVPVLKLSQDDGALIESEYLSESGAILNFLNKKYAKLPDNALVIQWLMWQVSTQGPAMGNWFYFKYRAEQKEPLAIKRFDDEVHRQLKLVDNHLSTHQYLADKYSIADISLFSWYHKLEKFDFDLKPYINIKRWLDQINKRDAVIQALTFDFNETIQIQNLEKL